MTPEEEKIRRLASQIVKHLGRRSAGRPEKASAPLVRSHDDGAPAPGPTSIDVEAASRSLSPRLIVTLRLDLLRRFHCSTSYSLLTGPQSTIRLHQRVRPGAGRLAGGCGLVLAAAGLKAGQEDYWIRQIAESRCEYLSGHGESPGQWYGARAATLGLDGIAKDQQCRAMFEGKDPITGEQVAQPKWVADPRSKLPAGPLAERLRALADERSIPVEALASSQALAGEVRAVLGRREDDRDACFDLCFSDVKSGSLFYAGADEATRREYVAARQEAIKGALGWLERHAVGVRRGHGGAEHLDGRGLLAIGYDHRTSREGDPQLHTHMLVQNLTEGPDGRATALDSKRLWAHLMTAERVYQQLWRAELSRRLGLEFVQVPDHEQLEIAGWDDKTLRDAFSKRAAQVRAQCDAWGTTDTRTAREAARATRRAKDHAETEEVIYDRWRSELAEHGIGERTYAERLGGATGTR